MKQHMIMVDPKSKIESEGIPLAVCISDCHLDCGQPKSELAVLCFQVHCAFAEMRWGNRIDPVHKAPIFSPQRLHQIAPSK